MPKDHSPLAFAVMALVIAGLLAGCTPAPPTPIDPPNKFGVLGAEGCDPISPIVDAEVQGTPTTPGESAYGEFQGVSPLPLRADSEGVKLVVRVTGSGDLGVLLSDPTGVERPLAWGPQAHTASNYERPGDEWGLGFAFDQPGCWQLALNRGSESIASFWLDVK